MKTADARSDLFALGDVLCAFSSGTRPFGGNSLAEIVRSVLTEEPEPLAQKRRDIRARLEATVRSKPAKDPDRRPQSAREVRAQLQAARDEITGRRRGKFAAVDREASTVVDTRLAARVAKVRQPLLLRRRKPAAASVVLVALALGVTVWMQGSKPVLSFAPRDWILLGDFEVFRASALEVLRTRARAWLPGTGPPNAKAALSHRFG